MLMEDLHDALPEKVQKLIGVLGAGLGMEFEEMMKSSAKHEITHSKSILDHIPADSVEDYLKHLAAVDAVPDGFLCRMFMDGFRNGFCACMKSINLCEEMGVDNLDGLLDELHRRASADPDTLKEAMTQVLNRLLEDDDDEN